MRTLSKVVFVEFPEISFLEFANPCPHLDPIAFGISDGGNRIGVTPSFIYFGILDILMIPVLAVAFLFLARQWDYGRMNIAFTQYGRVRASEGTYPEKSTTATGPAGGPVGGPVGEPAPAAV